MFPKPEQADARHSQAFDEALSDERVIRVDNVTVRNGAHIASSHSGDRDDMNWNLSAQGQVDRVDWPVCDCRAGH
jgi:hypothetical protein